MLKQLYSLRAVFHTSVISMLLLGNAVVAADCVAPAPFELLEDSSDNALNQTSLQAYLNDEKSVPALINFWAVWCAPCRTELPLLQRLNQDTGVPVQLVNIGDDKEKIDQLFNDIGITELPSQIVDSNVFSELKLLGLPASVVVTENDIYVGFGKLKAEEELSTWLTCLKDS